MQLERNAVYTVKIYFIEPVDIISIVMDTLVKLEFETYSVPAYNKEKLIKLLTKDIRNVVFLSVINEKEAEKHIKYIDRLNEIEGSHIQVGVFIHNTVKPESRMAFLERNAAVIQFSDIQHNTLGVLKKILTYFEAKGSRKYVRVNTTGQSEAYFTIKELTSPVKGKVTNISSKALLCKFTPEEKVHFIPGHYFHDVLLVLKGIRIRTSVKVLGFHKEDTNIYVFKICTAKAVNNKLIYTDEIPQDTKNKLHNYIKICLKESLARELKKVPD